MSNVDRDMSDSRTRFESIVWPKIKHWFGDSPDLHRTEDTSGPLREDFDIVGGVDYWVVERGEGMLSIASRVQTYDETTFTIRYSRSTGNDTEYQKRMRQLENDYELPTYTVQAYIDVTLGMLRNAAAIRTKELYKHLSTGEPGEDWPLIQSNESEYFFPIEWDELHPITNLKVYDYNRADLVKKTKQPDNPEQITSY